MRGNRKCATCAYADIATHTGDVSYGFLGLRTKTVTWDLSVCRQSPAILKIMPEGWCYQWKEGRI